MRSQQILLALLVVFTLALSTAGAPVYAASQGQGAFVANREFDENFAIAFSALGMPANAFLQGPLERNTLQFTLPPDWQLQDGAVLRLDATVFVSNFLVGQEERNLDEIFAGQLSATLNGILLGSEFLQGSGAHSIDFDVPLAALQGDPATGLHELVIEWDATASCNQNIAASLSLLAKSSFLSLPHQVVGVSPNLGDYPRPFVLLNNPQPAAVTLAVPDNASQEVLQGAVAVASSLGRLSGGALDFSMVTASQLEQSRHADSHLILVGGADSFEVVRAVRVPNPPSGEDGILHAVVSPWNKSREALLVTGASDQAVLKAAMALSSGQVVTADNDSTAFVGSLMMPVIPELDRDLTFADLGLGALTFGSFSVNVRDVPFYIPEGSAIGADAYLDLTFSHSQLLDFLRSGILVSLNGVIVGSIRLSDVSSSLNTVRLIIPATAIHSGLNHLELQVEIAARDACTDWRDGMLFVTLFPESVIHLPLSDAPILNRASADLGAFTASFSSDAPATFVLPGDDPASWVAAGRLAFAMGAPGGRLKSPNVLVTTAGQGFTPEGGNYIVIGQPGRAPAVSALENTLPVPFDASGQVSPDSAAQLPYQIDLTRSAGFLQAARLPSGDGTILLVAGNNSQGLDWASQALSDASLLRRMEGSNFAILQARNNVKASFVVRPSTETATAIPGAPVEPGGQPALEEGGQAGGQPARVDLWSVPLLVAAILAFLALLFWEIRSWRK